jgi:hypothetical protein
MTVLAILIDKHEPELRQQSQAANIKWDMVSPSRGKAEPSPDCQVRVVKPQVTNQIWSADVKTDTVLNKSKRSDIMKYIGQDVNTLSGAKGARNIILQVGAIAFYIHSSSF